jgi:hypothetical protein
MSRWRQLHLFDAKIAWKVMFTNLSSMRMPRAIALYLLESFEATRHIMVISL